MTPTGDGRAAYPYSEYPAAQDEPSGWRQDAGELGGLVVFVAAVLLMEKIMRRSGK